jgi:hypothetical protein
MDSAKTKLMQKGFLKSFPICPQFSTEVTFWQLKMRLKTNSSPLNLH